MPKIHKDKFEYVYTYWPKPICAKCGKMIQTFDEECPVKFLGGKYAIYRMMHQKCHDAHIIQRIIEAEIELQGKKGWKKYD